jgi:hypothetical protein
MIKLTPGMYISKPKRFLKTPMILTRRFYFLYEKRNVQTIKEENQKGIEMITMTPAKCILTTLGYLNRNGSITLDSAVGRMGVGTNSGHKPSFFTEITARAENTP